VYTVKPGLEIGGGACRSVKTSQTEMMLTRIQQTLPDREATIAALILASDKTQMTMMASGQQVYPVYATLGNIDKDIRRKPSHRANVLLGYLPVDDFKDVASDNDRQRLKGELIHRAMEILLEPLKEASWKGVEMWCTDKRLRRVYPIIAAYVADWPEQCLMTCSMESGCPVCTTKRPGRGDYDNPAPMRGRRETMDALRAFHEHDDLGELRQLNLKPWWPWWADIPYVNLSACITPDLLHQLHQGIFKTHILQWLAKIVGPKTLDERFIAMPKAEGMTHFGRGVTEISSWTGRESKEMARQFLPLVAGTVGAEQSQLVRAGIDFMFRAHASSMTEEDLDELEDALEAFHRLKPSILVPKVYTDPARFDGIPKLHMMGHYAHSIRELGTPDGYNSEAPEHLHIEYAKIPWRASSKVKPLPQMVKWIQRQEALRIHRVNMDDYWGTGKKGKGQGSTDERESQDEGPVVEVEGAKVEGAGAGNVAANAAGGETVGGGSNAVYPNPTLKIAARPTRPRMEGTRLIAAYGATDLIPALNHCLVTRFNVPARSVPLALHNLFNVWHRFYLFHSPLPFSPCENPRRNVVRATPPFLNKQGLVQAAAAFDTALYLDDKSQFGLQRKYPPSTSNIAFAKGGLLRLSRRPCPGNFYSS
jgi:hypothetical protein